MTSAIIRNFVLIYVLPVYLKLIDNYGKILTENSQYAKSLL